MLAGGFTHLPCRYMTAPSARACMRVQRLRKACLLIAHAWARTYRNGNVHTPLPTQHNWISRLSEHMNEVATQAKLNALEAELATSRNGMRLGYTDPGSGEFVAASSVLLRNLARTSPDERLRKACYEVHRARTPA